MAPLLAGSSRSLIQVFIIWFAGLGAAAQYGKISVIFDALPKVYPDAGAWLGFTVSLVGFVGIVLGVAAGILVSRIRFRRALIGGLLVGAVLSVLQAGLPSLGLFLATRVVEGLSHLAIVVAAPTLIAQISPDRLRGFTLTLWGSFFGVAYALLVWLGLPLVDVFGLGSLFYAHAIFMALMAVLVWVLVPEIDSGATPADATIRDLIARHKTIYASPSISAPGLGWLFYTFCFLSALTLLPPTIAPEMRALVIGALSLIGIVVSLTLGVWLLQRWSAVTVVQAGFVTSAGFAALLVAFPGNPVFILLFGAGLGLVQGASFAAVGQLCSTAEDRAASNGAMAQTGNIGNTLGTPVLLAVIGFAGHTVMMALIAGLLFAGAAGHQLLRMRRRVVAS